MKYNDLLAPSIILAMGLLLTVIAPYLFTAGWVDFSQTGPIGDTIGGITSPITNLIGAALVFFALKAQIESNELTRKQFEQQKQLFYITEQINITRNDINDFNFVHSTKTSTIEKGITIKSVVC